MYKILLLPLSILFLTQACRFSNEDENKMMSISLEEAQDTLQLFAEHFVSTKYNERDMAISADGNHLFYSLGTYNQSKRAIVHLHKNKTTWDAEIMSWSGKFNDIEPFLSPDGRSLFFASDRPMDSDSLRKDYNIWVSTYTGDIWAEPLALDTVINTKVDEFYPSAGTSGNLYFTAAHPGNHGREDIYMSIMTEGKYSTPVALDSNVNTAAYEFNAYISPGEDTIIFSSYGRKDDLGGGDLYLSARTAAGVWQAAHNLGPKINSASLDYCPFIDFPRKTFYFTSNRDSGKKTRIETIDQLKMEADKTLNGLDNIYCIKLSSLK